MTNKIVFLYPTYDPDNPNPDFASDKMRKQPIGVFALASYVRSIGYDVVLLDGRLFHKKVMHQKIIDECRDAFAVGFSVMTCQIQQAYDYSKMLKKLYPDLWVIWGGIHPTLFPEQCIKPDFVDFVVNGEGEYCVEQLLRMLKKNDTKSWLTIGLIDNLVWENPLGLIFINPLGKPIDINELPDPDYSMIPMKVYMEGPFWNYFDYEVERLFDICTSRGCPYKCTFCATTLPAFSTWRALTAERVNSLIDLAVTKFNAKHIWFTDDLFFVSKKRAVAIMEHIIDKKYDITWEALTTINLFKNILTDDVLALMKKSGGIVLGMGAESGSDRILKIINKPQQTRETIMYAMKQCNKHGIIPKPSFLTGIPGETHDEAKETIKLIADIAEVCPKTSFYVPSVFRPYPGTALYEECIKLGFKEPETLEAWLKYEFHDNYFIKPKDLPWIKDPGFHINIPYVTYNYLHYNLFGDKKNKPISRKIAGRLANLRIKRDIWAFPYEYKITRMKKNLEKIPLFNKLVRLVT
ncbi:MAG TPA: B12-binding domain-containing radical SAM protein [bacterium]|nr:B12-binding domain-containing radical SAM protein [bacterium]